MIKTDIPDLFILCGGFGKRARNLDSFKPKILITIKKKPFLYYVLKNLENQGVRNVVLCLGYKSELIKTYIKKNKKKFKINIFFSEEKKPLGTGGAIKKAAHKSKKGFFVMYGDTFLFFDLKKILNYCKYKRAEGVMTIFKNKDENYINNVYYNKKNFVYSKFIKNKKFNYIDYGLMYFNKNFFKIKKSKFDLNHIMTNLTNTKKIIPMVMKKKFLELGSIYGYTRLIKNFKLITNEIYK